MKPSSLFTDDTGAVSSMRVMSLAVVVPVMIVWMVISIRTNQFIIPDAKIIALLGTALGGKALQSFSENFSSGKVPAALAAEPALKPEPTPIPNPSQEGN